VGGAPVSTQVGIGSVLNAGFREPVIVVLLIAALFDGLSGNPLHSLVLVGAAVALAVARAQERVVLGPERLVGHWGTGPERLERIRSGMARSSIPLLLLPAIAFALVVGWFDRYSVVPSLTVAVVGAAAIGLSWHGPFRDEPLEPVDTSGKTLWVLVAAAIGGWELTNLFLQPSLTTDSWNHPTISVLADPVLGSRIWRSFFLFAWLRLGWGLLKR
jgi:hypothetical protein